MQEIIVYRNPMEAAMWHGLMNNPGIFLAFVGAGVVFVVAAILIDKITAKLNINPRKQATYQIWGAGIVAFVFLGFALNMFL